MNTALVVVDMQNSFCSPHGSYARRGGRIEHVDRVTRACQRVVAHARASDWLVVYTCLTFLPDYRDAGLLVVDNPMIKDLGAYVEGSEDAQIIDALRPLPEGARVVRKARYDPFCGTPLEQTLREQAIGEVVVCGVMTNVCVESTVRRAYDLDFPVRVVTDAVSSYDPDLHAAALETMGRHFATRVTVAELTGDLVDGS